MLLLLSCLQKTPPEVAVPQIPDTVAVTGVADPALRQLLHEHWEATMQRAPRWATRLGDHRWDDRLGDNSELAHRAAQRRNEQLLERAEGLDLQGEDGLTAELFVHSLRVDLEEERACRTRTWALGAGSNPVSAFADMHELHDLETEAGRADYRARLHQVPRHIENTIANLRVGLAEGRVSNAESIRRVIELVDTELARDDADRSLITSSEVAIIAHEEIDSALRAYRDFLSEELLPAALPEGLTHLPGGDACYRARIFEHTGLDRDPDTIHQTGLDELERIHAEMAVLGERLFGLTEVTEIAAHLRGSPELHFQTREQVEAKARDALATANARMPEVFARIPEAPCEVRAVPDHIAPYTYIAWYQTVDDSGVGYYYVNSWEPTTRPRWDAEALAFHEAVPGHHFQFALSYELEIPAFRRHAYETAYAEGWALYTERLADELGLYTGDLDRLGMLSFDAWRASRLVVDTGIHHKGWTRDEAVAFLRDNTLLAENNVDNEVDRYITWPGQALAYKLGQLEMLALRSEAEAALGEDFDLKAFHSQVLEAGAMPLPVLRRRIEAWTRTVKG